MMKPYVICHMNTSIDGRTWSSRWRLAENRMTGLFERIHEQLGNGSWLIGRVTGSEYAKADAYPDHAGEVFPREPWFVRRDAAAYGIALDAQLKMAWGRADIGGDPASHSCTSHRSAVSDFVLINATRSRPNTTGEYVSWPCARFSRLRPLRGHTTPSPRVTPTTSAETSTGQGTTLPGIAHRDALDRFR